MPAKGPAPAHGTRNRYQWREDPCRCRECVRANADYQATRRARIKAGAWGGRRRVA